jgi:hypothetical protein
MVIDTALEGFFGLLFSSAAFVFVYGVTALV